MFRFLRLAVWFTELFHTAFLFYLLNHSSLIPLSIYIIYPGITPPPHTRGLRDTFVSVIDTARIIPAYAGTAHLHGDLYLDYRDHPRTRGDYWLFKSPKVFFIGSPPHTRGLQSMISEKVNSCRITPAYAGTTAHLDITYSTW